MAGSIRIPSAFNGIFGLLSSPTRLPSFGQMT
jgi:Asp-tRNA(Asn)/Glu-tRNA(Gln) amidotransferase A subunit family amidase